MASQRPTIRLSQDVLFDTVVDRAVKVFMERLRSDNDPRAEIRTDSKHYLLETVDLALINNTLKMAGESLNSSFPYLSAFRSYYRGQTGKMFVSDDMAEYDRGDYSPEAFHRLRAMACRWLLLNIFGLKSDSEIESFRIRIAKKAAKIIVATVE